MLLNRHSVNIQRGLEPHTRIPGFQLFLVDKVVCKHFSHEYMYVDSKCYFSIELQQLKLIFLPFTGGCCWWSASPSIKQQKVNLFRPVEPLFTVTPGQAYPLGYINESIIWKVNPLVVAATNIKFKSASECVMDSDSIFIIASLYPVRLKNLWVDKIALVTFTSNSRKLSW